VPLRGCRRQSGAPFSLNVAVDRAALTCDISNLKTFTTIGADNGEARERIFCPECGSPIIAEAPERGLLPRSLLS
jgi:hypothetical protein